MIRKYHNHKLQTTPWQCEEEPLNHHETPGRQIKQSNQLSLPHQDQVVFSEYFNKKNKLTVQFQPCCHHVAAFRDSFF